MMSKLFYCARNNGVTSCISAEDYAKLPSAAERPDVKDTRAWKSLLEETDIRIFTFCSTDRLIKHPEFAEYYTGSREDFERLVIRGNEVVYPNEPLYVPFSRGDGNMRCDGAFIICPHDLQDVFGEYAETILV